jgi:hypothetical protein
MDLDYHDRPDLASAFAASMAGLTSDNDLRDLLDLYKCYRACVRGKVEGMRSREPEVEAQERQASKNCAVRHFQLALNYAVTGSEPVVLAIMGRIGSGKSTVAQLLCEALGWKLESSDVTRKRLAAKRRLLESSDHAGLYTESMTADTYDSLIDSAVKRAAGRHSTILDATFGNKARRDRLREELRAAGVRYCFIELTAPDSVLKERLRQRDNASAHDSDARLENFDRINALYEEPDALEDAHHREVNAARSAEVTAHEVLKHLAAYKLGQ